jgi:superfamily II DNA or RNA helicase
MSSVDPELKAIEERLSELEQEKQSLLKRKQQLLAGGVVSNRVADAINAPASTQQKVALFGSLFRGREDVHAVRWENKQGRNGYAPACDNEWRQGICHKPKVKCGECRHQAFQPLDERVLYEHLSGQRTVGLYPLLPDENTWFLTLDFDKSDWQQAVLAFRRSCEEWGIPCSLERSRSGDGAHAWLFFEQAIPAALARRLGFALLDKAMEQHAGLSFDSYDRLFPNQDTLPAGGFGNLIALPLQRGPRQSGNSVFIDENLEPYPDQWAYLSAVKRLRLQLIERCIARVTDSADEDNDELKPWEKGLPLPKSVISGCPERLEITLANRIYVPMESIPNALLARLKRFASFSNPVFFKTQALRFSTHGIPRFISLSQIDQGYLSLPSGCLDDVLALLSDQSIELKVDDKRMTGRRLSGLKFKGSLRPEQKKAVAALAKHDTGVLHAPTAFGKTVTAIGLIQKRKVSTLILVHSRQLLDQWKERLDLFLEGCEIGMLGGGKKRPSGEIDIATYQSLIHRKTNSVDERLFDYGQIIVDECHHISAPRYEALLSESRAKYLLGITATPHRQDGHQPLIFMLAGPIRHAVKNDNRHEFEQRVIVRRLDKHPPFDLSRVDSRPHIADVYRWLMHDEDRNHQIVEDVVAEVQKGRHPLLLTERREHATMLADLLRRRGITCEVLRGAMRAKERDAVMAALDDTQVLIATGKYIGEGFDLPRLDTLFLGLPISWKGSLAQYAGRIHRQSAGKDMVVIYDYLDASLPTLERMFGRRAKAYEALGYSVGEGEVSTLVQGKLGQATLRFASQE